MNIRILWEFFAAALGTMAFALLFHVPRKYYGYCGLIGGCGWVCYEVLLLWCSAPLSTFFANTVVVFLSRLFAVRRECPVTVFLSLESFLWFRVPVSMDRLLCSDKRSGSRGRKRVCDSENRSGHCTEHSAGVRASTECLFEKKKENVRQRLYQTAESGKTIHGSTAGRFHWKKDFPVKRRSAAAAVDIWRTAYDRKGFCCRRRVRNRPDSLLLRRRGKAGGRTGGVLDKREKSRRGGRMPVFCRKKLKSKKN